MGIKDRIAREGAVRLLLSIALAANVMATMVGCGNKIEVEIPEDQAQEQTETETDATVSDLQDEADTDEAVADSEEEDEKAAIVGDSAQSFSEGLAWVKFAESEGESERYGCIDKGGKVLFAFPKGYEDAEPTPFDNGYSFVTIDESSTTVVDPDGNVVPSDKSSITIVDTKGNVKTFNASELGDISNVDKEERAITACGGGYFVLYRHQQADFDKDDYPWIYEVYDAEGNYIDYLSSTNATWTAYYCGQGVFEFKRDYNGDDSVLFFPRSDKFIQMTPTTDVIFVDDEDTAFVAEGEDLEIAQAVGEEDWQDSTVSGLVFVSKDGEIMTYEAPDGVEAFGDDPRVSDDLIILYGWEDGSYYSYNVKTSVLNQMPEEYARRDPTANRAIFHDGACAMLVAGADNKTYYCVYDSEWNRLFDPIEAMIDHSYSGGAGGSTHVYGGAYYSDGLMAIMMGDGNGDYMPTVIDKSGKVLFTRDEGHLSQLVDDVFVYTPLTHAFDEGLYDSGVLSFNISGNSEKPFEFLDKEGEPLFAELNTDDMKTLTFSS